MRVVVPDRPGYGDSGGPAGGFFFNAEAAVNLLDRLGIASAVVTGHSWGCGVAMASRFPERVTALVLIGSLVPRPKPELVDRAFATQFFGRMAIRGALSAAGVALSVPLFCRLGHSVVPGFTREELQQIGAEWQGQQVWRNVYVEQRALVDESPMLASEIASICIPAIILSGPHDPISSPAWVRKLAGALPNAKVMKLKAGGHLLPQQRPGVVAEAITTAAA